VPAFSVKTAQQQLVACGFRIAVTGSMDAQTREAIRFFQAGWCGKRAFNTTHGKLTPYTRLALAYAARNDGTLGRKAKDFRYREFRLDNKGDPRVRRKIGIAAQAYRNKFGPTTVLRSSSTPEHNLAVGGKSNSRHLFPEHWDAIDVSPQNVPTAKVTALRVWTGIGHHAATGTVDHVDLRPGDPGNPAIFPDN
jgi:hypothetical protein